MDLSASASGARYQAAIHDPTDDVTDTSGDSNLEDRPNSDLTKPEAAYSLIKESLRSMMAMVAEVGETIAIITLQ
jgi:hypothetical protein